MKITFSFEKKLLKKIVRIAVFAVILTSCFLFAFFFKGTLDISLYSGVDLPEINVPLDPPHHDTVPDSAPSTDNGNSLPPNPFLGIEAYTGRGAYSGYELSELPYDGNTFKLVAYNTDTFIPTGFSYSTNDDGSFTPAMHPRMGFIFMTCDDGKKLIISPFGEVIIDDLLDNLVFLGERDSAGNPVFRESGSYYYFDYTSGSFKRSDYDSERDNKFIEFDYPSYYEAPCENIRKYYSGSAWGFMTEDGKVIVEPTYRGAFQYTEEHGALYDRNDRVYIYEFRGYQKYNYFRYYLPETRGTESLGYYIFDHGLMRVRTKSDYAYKEYVLQRYGDFMHMPDDFDIISYSDGIFLLEKEGRYGYMSYEGRWIAQPTFTFARPFFEGLGVIGYENGKKGVVDTAGNFVLPMEFDQITDCSGGVITLYDKDYGWKIVHKLKQID